MASRDSVCCPDVNDPFAVQLQCLNRRPPAWRQAYNYDSIRIDGLLVDAPGVEFQAIFCAAGTLRFPRPVGIESSYGSLD